MSRTLIFLDGFKETSVNNTWATSAYRKQTSGTWTFGTGRFDGSGGGRGYNWTEDRRIEYGPFADAQTWVMHFAYQAPSSGVTKKLIGFIDDSTEQAYLQVNSDGSLGAYNGDDTLLGSSSAGVITFDASTWHTVEILVKVDGSAGVFLVRVDSTLVIDLSAGDKDTQNSGNATADRIFVYPVSNSMDDFAIWTATTALEAELPTEGRVTALLPTSDDSNGFTRSGGASAYLLVDDAEPDGDSTYVESDVVGTTDLLGHTTFAEDGSILGVSQIVHAKKTDAGARTMVMVCKSGGSTYESSEEFTLTTSNAYYEYVWENDPDTAALWTKTALNNAKFGYKVKT